MSEPRRRATPSAQSRLPFWLRSNKRPRARAPRPSLRDGRWWVGVVWMTLSLVALGFVAHVTLFGVLQHERSQTIGYQQLRTSLAKAETPLGQLDTNEKLVAAGTPIALIDIDSIGVHEVVMQGSDPEVLREGVGHRRDTVMPGQEGTSVLYGRLAAYGGPFGKLGSLAPGDKITVTTGQATHQYKVFGLRRPGDPLPEPLAEGDGRLQLVTADGLALAPGGVLYVDASLVGDPSETPAPVYTAAVLVEGEGVMESDPSGLLPLLFTFQWLAVAVVVTRLLLRNWGRWQTWIVAAPVLLVLAASTADRAMALLPNLI